jgi:hypothetical protein
VYQVLSFIKSSIAPDLLNDDQNSSSDEQQKQLAENRRLVEKYPNLADYLRTRKPFSTSTKNDAARQQQ